MTDKENDHVCYISDTAIYNPTFTNTEARLHARMAAIEAELAELRHQLLELLEGRF